MLLEYKNTVAAILTSDYQSVCRFVRNFNVIMAILYPSATLIAATQLNLGTDLVAVKHVA